MCLGCVLDKYAGAKRFKLQSLADAPFAIGQANLPDKLNKFDELMNSSLSRATWSKYNSGYNAFCAFEESCNKKFPWPLSKEVWRAFIIWCHSARNLSKNSIHTYLSALKYVHTLKGFSHAHLSDDSLSAALLKGVEHSSLSYITHPNTRRVMTLPLLLTLREKIAQQDWDSLDKQVLWAASTTAFFGSTRIGEILASQEKSFSEKSDLQWKDVRFSSPHSLLVHLKQPKSGIPGGEMVDLFEFPSFDCCPVQALKNLRSKQIQAGMTDETLPVFRFRSGKNLTPSLFNKTLKALLSDLCAPGKDKISGHSFRAGIPSTLSMFPDLVTSDMVQGWGRWKSDCYKLYTRLTLTERGNIFEKIKQALLSVPLV